MKLGLIGRFMFYRHAVTPYNFVNTDRIIFHETDKIMLVNWKKQLPESLSRYIQEHVPLTCKISVIKSLTWNKNPLSKYM